MGVFHDMFDRTVAEMFSVPRLGPQLDIRQAAREDAVICSRAVGRHFTIGYGHRAHPHSPEWMLDGSSRATTTAPEMDQEQRAADSAGLRPRDVRRRDKHMDEPDH
jgi:hypothetical protein